MARNWVWTCLESSRTTCGNSQRRNSAMPSAASIAVVIGALSVLLAILVALRPETTRVREGRILAFLALFVLPSVAVWVGVSQHMERAKTTEFCLSCHAMED